MIGATAGESEHTPVEEKTDIPSNVNSNEQSEGEKEIEQRRQEELNSDISLPAVKEQNAIAINKKYDAELRELRKKTADQEKVAQTEEKNIPLTSQTKTTENGKEESNAQSEASPENGKENATEGHEENDEEGVTPEEEPSVKPVEKQASPLTKKEKAKARRDAIVQGNEPVPDLAAAKTGEANGLPESEVDHIVKENAIEEPSKPLDNGIQGKSNDQAETGQEFKKRIHHGWNYIKKNAKDGDVVVTHSSVINLITAAEKHGWMNPDLLQHWADEEETQGKQPTTPGELIPYEISKDKTIYLARHGESQDGQQDKMRREDTPLTKSGKKEAVRIAKSLKEQGITDPHIFHSTLKRAEQTADIIRKELDITKATDVCKLVQAGVMVDAEFSDNTVEVLEKNNIDYIDYS